MISPSLRRRFWLLGALLAIAFLLWSHAVRRERIAHVSSIGIEADTPDRPDQLRRLIIPEHITPSYGWITRAQQMLEAKQLRIRHVASDNAPGGRIVHAASPYHWWLGLLAWVDQTLSGAPPAAAVERAALWADPLLHLLLVGLTTAFVARHFGPGGAALVGAALVLLYPFGAGFLPAVPDDFALFLALSPWFVLPLLVPLASLQKPPGRPAPFVRWYARGGVLAGCGLWLNVTLMVPVLFGLALGGLLAAWLTRREPASSAPPEAWRAWGAAGAATVLVAYLVEYFPGHLGGWELRAVHPLYALTWLGAALVLALGVAWLRGDGLPRQARGVAGALFALAATAALPVVMWRTGNLGFLNADLLSFRLTKETDGVLAPNLLDWLGRSGLSGEVAATLAPLVLPLLAIFLLTRPTLPRAHRAALALALGALVPALALGAVHLRWWQLFGGFWLALLAVTAACVQVRALGGGWRLALPLLVGLCLLLGAVQLVPRGAGSGSVLSLPEVEGLVERDLARTLAQRLGPDASAIVHAPPTVSTALHYYGGLPGLASLHWENKDGLSVALRIVISTSREEAHALTLSRGVTHFVLPSWDPFYGTYTQAASIQTSELFYDSLQRWVLPMWLRPVAYQMPTVGGFENQSVTVLEVVDEQEPPVAMSRVTEYFIDLGQLEAARAAVELLQRYPADFSALVARGQYEAARGDAEAFNRTLQTIVQRLNARADRVLPWDRRVSLAIVLARGGRLDLARPQAERLVQQLDEKRLRSLSTQTLFHLQILLQALELPFADPAQHTLARELLPLEFRQRLQP